ncbi:telomere-associated recQ-like helicase protein [Rutstroemia sp. NJR-2017a BBW]|nr:telomere-associated recQ-like helicase protein [Rutstroemia sp. NJR-2017a BBW]
MFLITATDGRMALCPRAMEIYEVYTQEFLKRVLVLCHISPDCYCKNPNSLGHIAKQSSPALSVGVEEAGDDLHPVLQGSAAVQYVQRQHPVPTQGHWGFSTRVCRLYPAFEATLPPTADSRCSHHALPLGQAGQDHFAASITKEKFSAKEQANFDLEEGAEEEIEDELDLVALAELSNYSYHTFNHTYTGTTTLTISTLLHRASES